MKWQLTIPAFAILFGFAVAGAFLALGPHEPASAKAAQPAYSRAPAQTAPGKKDIVDTAVGAGQFKTLVAAVQTAELVDVLKGAGPFTVFAPTDEAFAKISKEKLDSLLKDKQALSAVLTYHVVPGKVMAGDILKVTSAPTVQGKPLMVSVKVNEANVIKTDIECANGVIHVIDTVLLPPAGESRME
jgi:uncharacterized surface protein with fasciclin (FAS1) repeats